MDLSKLVNKILNREPQILNLLRTEAGLYSNLFMLIDWLYNTQNNNIIINPAWIYNNNNNIFTYFFEDFNNNIKIDNIKSDWTYLYLAQLKYKEHMTPYLSQFKGNITNININKLDCITDIIPDVKGYFWMKVFVYKHKDFFILRERYHNIINTYIIPKKNISDIYNSFYNQYMNSNKWIGIHLRTPQHHYIRDYDNNLYVDKVIDSINDIIIRYNDWGIFVASDIEILIDKLKNKYTEKKVICYPQNRLKGNSGNLDWCDKNNDCMTEMKYAIIDMMLLSKCDYLLGGVSNMFMMSLCVNKEVKFEIIPYLEKMDAT